MPVRFIESAFRIAQDAQLVVGVKAAGIEGQGLLEALGGIGVAPLLAQRDPVIEGGFRRVRHRLREELGKFQ